MDSEDLDLIASDDEPDQDELLLVSQESIKTLLRIREDWRLEELDEGDRQFAFAEVESAQAPHFQNYDNTHPQDIDVGMGCYEDMLDFEDERVEVGEGRRTLANDEGVDFDELQLDRDGFFQWFQDDHSRGSPTRGSPLPASLLDASIRSDTIATPSQDSASGSLLPSRTKLSPMKSHTHLPALFQASEQESSALANIPDTASFYLTQSSSSSCTHFEASLPNADNTTSHSYDPSSKRLPLLPIPPRNFSSGAPQRSLKRPVVKRPLMLSTPLSEPDLRAIQSTQGYEAVSLPKKKKKTRRKKDNERAAGNEIGSHNTSAPPSSAPSSRSFRVSTQPLADVMFTPSVSPSLESTADSGSRTISPGQSSKEPTLEEMDAFFGFKHPVQASIPLFSTPPSSSPSTSMLPVEKLQALLLMSPSSSPTQSANATPSSSNSSLPLPKRLIPPGPAFTRAQKGKGKEVEGNAPPVVDRSVVSVASKDTTPSLTAYQLKAIVSSNTSIELTAEETRLSIISALESITLSILLQLAAAAIPPLSPDPILPNSRNHETEAIPPTPSDDNQNRQDKVAVVKVPRAKIWKPSPVVVVLAKRTGGKTFNPTMEGLELDALKKTKRNVYPRGGSSPDAGARTLARFLKVVEFILEGLRSKVVSTKRDLYYRNVKLFGTQQVLDTLVEDIAATLQVRRSDLNIVAASKGLFGGHIKIVGTDGVVREGGELGCLTPPSQSIERIEVDDVKWILIIEKEAVFQSLCNSTFLDTPDLGKGVLLTGKGYPDIATRELVHRLSLQLPLIPILCLVDSDPHGLEILSTYKFGSASLAFDQKNLAGDRIEWLGVKGSEWDEMGVERSELLELTKGDRKKALGMLGREWIPVEWKKELEYMLHLGRKAEIQVLASQGHSIRVDVSGDCVMNSQSEVQQSASTSRLFEYVANKIRTRIA